MSLASALPCPLGGGGTAFVLEVVLSHPISRRNEGVKTFVSPARNAPGLAIRSNGVLASELPESLTPSERQNSGKQVLHYPVMGCLP